MSSAQAISTMRLYKKIVSQSLNNRKDLFNQLQLQSDNFIFFLKILKIEKIREN